MERNQWTDIGRLASTTSFVNPSLFAKLWDAHLVSPADEKNDFLYIDRIFLHERMGAVALKGMLEKGRVVRKPSQVFSTIDHIVDTEPGRPQQTRIPNGEKFIHAMRDCARQTGIHLYDLDDVRQGIVHLVAAEQGIAHPGLTLVCPDSHTSTLGALGVLAWGLGASDTEHALVTRTLKIQKPQTMRVTFGGKLSTGVTAKDMALFMISTLGACGGRGYALEYAGDTIRKMSMSGRFTLCNMAVEFGAFCGLVSVDETTMTYVNQNRPFCPRQVDFSKWRTEAGATFDQEISLDAAGLAPMVTWGTSPEHGLSLEQTVPEQADCRDPSAAAKAMDYMAVKPGLALQDLAIDAAFIVSCTNTRLEDLRLAANLLKGRKVKANIKAVCVPGSTQTKRQAEQEGLDRIFRQAGFEWHEAGCAMCFYAGGQALPAGSRAISTSNRNFEGRQGPGVRTHLASPLTVAAAALTGRITDPRELLS